MQKRPVRVSELSDTIQKALQDLEEVSQILADLGLKKPYLTCTFEEIEKDKNDPKND
jgi:hypothetical protein